MEVNRNKKNSIPRTVEVEENCIGVEAYSKGMVKQQSNDFGRLGRERLIGANSILLKGRKKLAVVNTYK